ncbi:MAG: aspartate carbamoyltransferase catalytic subunit [Cyanobacteria bacterium MAG CAR3_bin_5]|nr:aspartate carbamoyltransferase catalytic subunit [Cyanobacteria bacterium MAG CAR3_bin_5]MCY4236539.1 aspartate carbamoyltransferase catalytic subunit [Cyanobacteria bacterium MAG CAR2_bin_4]
MLNNHWSHRHLLDLAVLGRQDFELVLELAERFRALPSQGPRRLPALQGRMVATLFFEPSTRTRTSFEIAARRLSADVASFTPAASALAKGESLLDTALTYAAMGAELLVVRHSGSGVPGVVAQDLEAMGHRVAVLNGGDGLHGHPSQALLDLFTLARHFAPRQPTMEALAGRTIAIVGDILHSRVARSNLWALSAAGATIHLCGPSALLPNCFADFLAAMPPGCITDPVPRRGRIHLFRNLDEALTDVDAVITLRLQKERAQRHLIPNLEDYHRAYGITHARLERCRADAPVLHPGPVNRDVELSSRLLAEPQRCLVNRQVSHGIPIRMALLYLLATTLGS